MAWCAKLGERLNRKKTLDSDIMDTPLSRCLTTVDLALLGIGHMLGAGIFVLTGTVVKDIAGPGTLLSYFFAGIAAMLAALCYAEFGARVPKAGSAYTYTYVTIGEFIAFLIGWNIVLEHMLGVASVARAWSGSFDSLLNGMIRNSTLSHVGRINVPWLSEYPDFIAFSIVVVFMCFIAGGAKLSTNVNSVFTIINLVVILIIIFVGVYIGDSSNWKKGGFLPYGFSGTLAGAATCFYAYIGFEGIAVAGEEAKHPEKSIPLATGIAVSLVTALYVASTASLTLMIPYDEVDVAAPFPSAFIANGTTWLRYVIAIGALLGISTSLLGSLFALPRAIYAMAADGLFFRLFARIYTRTQTPIVAVVVFGILAGLLALLVDIETLVEFLSIGTLCSFTIVAAGVLVLRYQPVHQCPFKLKPEDEIRPETPESEMQNEKRHILKNVQSHDDIGKLKPPFSKVPLLKDMDDGKLTIIAITTMGCGMFFFSLLLAQGYEYVESGSWWAILLLLLLSIVIVGSFSILWMHEQNVSFITFQVPCVPLVPSASMFLNILMMLKLNPLTWIRLAVWVAIGVFIYFIYGIHHSSENKPLSAYSQIITYNEASDQIPAKLKETVHNQQPKDAAYYNSCDQQPKEAVNYNSCDQQPQNAAYYNDYDDNDFDK